MRKEVTPPVKPIPKVWAIRTKGWIELRKGAQPRAKTTTAQVEVKRHRPIKNLQWDEGLSRFVGEKSKVVTEKVTLKTTIFVGGTPFKWVPLNKFARTAGVIKDGEVKAVSPFLAAVYLGLKPEREGRDEV